METAEGPVSAALFVDFDNIYSGLKALDPSAAEAFATDPGTWLGWLARGADRGEEQPRRFLLQLCYLNPNVYGRYRAFFTRSGFRVVDCPPLTALGKTSADIHIVLDVVDALAHQTRYDEFVIASADADFTPVLFRLRAHDRRTTVVTAGPASAAYRAMCDSVILPDEFAEATSRRVKPSPAEAASDRPAAELDSKDLQRAVDALRATVAGAPAPVVSASVAHAVRAAAPAISATGWAGTGSFRAFVARHAPEIGWARLPSPGYLYDPERHAESDLPDPGQEQAGATLTPVLDQVCRVTGTPHLSAAQYRVLFEELAKELSANGFIPAETSRRVRDSTLDGDIQVSRTAVNFVLQGLIYAGEGKSLPHGARELADAFLANVKVLCENAQMELSERDLDELSAWIVGSP